MSTTIAIGDARTRLKRLASESIHSCVTSPPFWMLRHYNAGPNEIGREPTIQQYVANLMQVIDEIHRILVPDGTFFLNLGDTYATQAGTSRGTSYPETGPIRNVGNGQLLMKSKELPHKCLCLIPYRVAIEMENRGWIVRNLIIWHKLNGLPESVRDRFPVDFEPIFLCVKSPKYFFRQQFRPYSENTLDRCKRYIENGEAFDPTRHKVDPSRPTQAPSKLLERLAKNLRVPGRTAMGLHIARANGVGQDVFNPSGAKMRCVWQIPTANYRGSHFAVFPELLVERCIEAGCPPGGTVLDPFLGSGTVAVVAERLGRHCYGIDLNSEYAQQARERILAARLKKIERIRCRQPTTRWK